MTALWLTLVAAVMPGTEPPRSDAPLSPVVWESGLTAKTFPRTARLLWVEGIALEVVAGIHFAATPLLRGWVKGTLSASEFAQVWPPFALDHIVAGILLVPIGLSIVLLSEGIKQGERRAWILAMINAVCLIALPVAMALLMGPQYFSAPPFLAAASLVTAVGLSMWAPLFVYRRDFL